MDEFDRLTIINNDGLLSASRGFLWVCGFVYLFVGCASGYNLGAGEYPDVPQVFGVLLGISVFLLCAVLGVLNFVVANGLANGSRWAWYLAIVVAVLYIPSCCFPIGALILVGLLRTNVRQAYGISKA